MHRLFISFCTFFGKYTENHDKLLIIYTVSTRNMHFSSYYYEENSHCILAVYKTIQVRYLSTAYPIVDTVPFQYLGGNTDS